MVGPLFFSYGFLTYLSLALALFFAYLLVRTRYGLNLRAVGENPATADAAGINVTRYKYFFTILGGAVAGLGGLYFVMEYLGGTWQNNGFGDRGWLAIALVIFALWRPLRAIWGSFVFGGLYILFAYIPLGDAAQGDPGRCCPTWSPSWCWWFPACGAGRRNSPPPAWGCPISGKIAEQNLFHPAAGGPSGPPAFPFFSHKAHTK